MKRWVVPLVCVVFILMAVPFSAKGDMQLPEFDLGDQWVYSVNLKLEEMATLSGDWTFEVEDVAMVSGHEVYDMSLTGDGTATFGAMGIFPYTLEGFTYVRKSDLATVKESIMIDFDTSLIGSGFYLSAFINMSYDPPLNQFDFPIEEGDTWSAITSTTFGFNIVSNLFPTNSTSTTVSISTDFEVESKETVDVAAGKFTTYKIEMEEENGNTTYTYMSTKSGYMVKMRIYNSTGASTGTMNLKSYTYTAPATEDGDFISDLMGSLWLLLILLVAIVVLVILVVLLSKRSKRKQEPSTGDMEPIEEPSSPEEQ